MANTIKGNNDGLNGRNETYNIPGRGTNIPRGTIVREIESGKHKNFHVYTINNEKYVAANPDKKKSNNVNNQ